MLKWAINKDILEAAIDILTNVPARNGIKSSEYIKISKAGKDGVTLTLTSDLMAQATVRTGDPFPFKEELYLDRRLFLPFVAGGKESNASGYVFTQKNIGMLYVQHGTRRAVYQKLKPVAGYEDAPDMEKAKAASLDKRWIELVKAAADCATDDPVIGQLNCVYINPTESHLEIMSSNSIVVFRAKTEIEKNLNTSIAFPLLLIDVLGQQKAKRLSWTSKVAMIEFSKGKVWQPVKIAARKNFPVDDIEKLIEQAEKNPVVLAMNGTLLSAVAKRISDYVAALSSEALVLTLRIEKGSRKVTIESGQDSSKFSETLNMLKKAKEDITIEWPLDHVMATLLFIKDDGIARIRYDENSRRASLHTKSISLIVAAEEKETKTKKEDRK